jgi:hypothetical protein
MKSLRKMMNWFRDGNDCAHCPAGWDECSYTEGGCEYDGGCYIYGDEYPEPCRLLLPKFVRAFLARRQKYFKNHEYDDFGGWWEKREAGREAIREEIKRQMYQYYPHYICWKNEVGEYQEVDTNAYIDQMAWGVRDAYEDFLKEPRKTLRQKWAELIKETVSIPVDYIKSYICE